MTMPESGLVGVFVTMRPALLRFLQSRGCSAADAEDIAQDMHMKLAGEPLGPVAEPRAYLYRMATNKLLLLRRTAGRRMRREEDWDDVHGGGDGERDERSSIEAQLIAREQLAILQRVLDGLPERTRTIFRRFRIDGEAQRGIAQDLGISVSAVEKHLARAYAEIASAQLRLDGEKALPRYLSAEGTDHGN